jgi:hypothetical protein
MSQHGQGKPLPEFLKLAGEWIIEGYFFLYYSDGQAATEDAPRFTRGASREDGQPCIGFDIAQLAAALDLKVDDVLLANQQRRLVLRGTADTPPTHGGKRATVYAFRVGDRNGYLTIETSHAEKVA